MPFSPSVALSDFSDEKLQALPRPQRQPFAEQAAQLVLGGDDSDPAARTLKAGNSVSTRRTSGRSSSPLSRSRDRGSSCRKCRALAAAGGDDGEVVGVGEGRHHALRDQAWCPLSAPCRTTVRAPPRPRARYSQARSRRCRPRQSAAAATDSAAVDLDWAAARIDAVGCHIRSFADLFGRQSGTAMLTRISAKTSRTRVERALKILRIKSPDAA